MWIDLRRLFTPTVLILSPVIACVLTAGFLAWIGWTASPPGAVALVPASLTRIPAPTSTLFLQPTPTMTVVSAETTIPSLIWIGSYVQINGTGGVGLRLRAQPGLKGELLFLGEEAEVFQVRDGPRQADGYIWWYLVAPYDKTRAGWAAADYLIAIPTPP